MAKRTLVRRQVFEQVPALARLIAMVRIRAPRLATGLSTRDLGKMIVQFRRIFADWSTCDFYLPEFLTIEETAKRLGRSPQSLDTAAMRDQARRTLPGRTRSKPSLALDKNLTPFGCGTFTFYLKSEVEALAVRLEQRKAAMLAEMQRRANACIPDGALSIVEVAKRIHRSKDSVAKAAVGQSQIPIPRMHQTSARYWYSTEADLAEFEEGERRKGEDGTIIAAEAAALLGMKRHQFFIFRQKRLTNIIIRSDRPHTFRYLRTDVEALVPAAVRWLARPVQPPPALKAGIPASALPLGQVGKVPRALRHVVHRAENGRMYVLLADAERVAQHHAARAAARAAREEAEQRKKSRPLIPAGSLSLPEVLRRLGVNRKHFEHHREGRQAFPVHHKIGPHFSGLIYVWPHDLEAFLDARKARPPLLSIPAGALPMNEALRRIGMPRRRFDKIRQGRSQTPIPVYHKEASSGCLYVWPADLDAFISDGKRMMIVVDAVAKQRERMRLQRGRAAQPGVGYGRGRVADRPPLATGGGTLKHEFPGNSALGGLMEHRPPSSSLEAR